nr:hypothetical protein [Tanacetum cinerariifolium]
ILSHEVVDDDLCKPGIVHLVALLCILMINLINEVFPQKVAMTEAEQIKLAIKKSLQQTYISQASGSGTDEGTGIIPGVPDDDDDQDEGDDDDDQDEGNDDDDQDTDEEGEEFTHPKLSIHDEEETKDEESFDPITKTPKNSDDE